MNSALNAAKIIFIIIYFYISLPILRRFLTVTGLHSQHVLIYIFSVQIPGDFNFSRLLIDSERILYITADYHVRHYAVQTLVSVICPNLTKSVSLKTSSLLRNVYSSGTPMPRPIPVSLEVLFVFIDGVLNFQR